MFVQLNSLWNSLWNSVSQWQTAIKFGYGNLLEGDPIYGKELELLFFFLFSKIVLILELVKNFSYRSKMFTWWFYRPPIFSDTGVGSSPDIWNQGNPVSTVAHPQIRFQIWIRKVPNSCAWEQVWLPGGADPRAQGRLLRMAGSAGRLAAAHPGQPPGMPLAQGPAPAAAPLCPQRPGRAHCSLRCRAAACSWALLWNTPAPEADREFSPPWLHN